MYALLLDAVPLATKILSIAPGYYLDVCTFVR